MTGRKRASVACAGLLMVLSAIPAFAGWDGSTSTDGSTLKLTQRQLLQMGQEYQKLLAANGPHWRYRSSIASCELGGRDAGDTCYASAVAACASNAPAEGRGPLVDVFRMWVDEDDKPLSVAEWPKGGPLPSAGPWALAGSTCLPNMVPGAKPVPTLEMIASAFHRTSWAKGAISTQPKGNTTLVNLKTFYKVDWAAAGFEPGEVDRVDPATMFGYRVEIRPKRVSYV